MIVIKKNIMQINGQKKRLKISFYYNNFYINRFNRFKGFTSYKKFSIYLIFIILFRLANNQFKLLLILEIRSNLYACSLLNNYVFFYNQQ